MTDQRPLINESSDASDIANRTPALPSLGFSSSSHALNFNAHRATSPPLTSPRSRPGYTRLQSDIAAVERNTPETLVEEDEEEDIADSLRSGGGLRIATPASPPPQSRRVSIQTIPRVPVGARGSSIRSPSIRSPSILNTPDTGDSLLGGFPKDSAGSTPDLHRERFSPHGEGDYEHFRRSAPKHARSNSSPRDDYNRYLSSPDTDKLRKGAGAPSFRSAYDRDEFRPTEECPTSKDFFQSRFSWVSVTIIIICLFSTVFSGIFLVLALKKPMYGRRITTRGGLKPGDAIVLTAVMAKLIELSFVTSFVAFLGQVLSRRAFMKEHGRGVTLSELSMWRWVVQPGTLITHWETAKYAGISVLGILSLLSAILATLYTPAATALVQPILKYSDWEGRTMVGQVKTQFANINYLKETCATPIRSDKAERGSTCLQISHAAQGYHNYRTYLSSWSIEANRGNGTSDQNGRPPGFGLLHDNTTVTAKWINPIDTTKMSKEHGRAINNVSLAMPHTGVFQAARDSRNNILQPEDLNSEGNYFLNASVPSPVMHILCANMKEQELAPIVYAKWPNAKPVDINTWVDQQPHATTKNKTAVDDIFGWTKNDSAKMLDYPPVFAKLPKPFNTIMNHTNYAYGRDSIYLLGQGGNDLGVNNEGQYFICQIKASITPYCSTHYKVMGSGGALEANCYEDSKDPYIKSLSNATKIQKVADWRDIGLDWSNSMSLNTGIMDGNASNSRLLTQLVLQPTETGEFKLNPALPSPAEALAVLSGCTLLMSSLDSPYVEFWNYSVPMLETPQDQYFNASVRAQQYGSGGADEVSQGWTFVLLMVFLMNIFVLIYFLLHRGLVTDFSEPPNLFALAVNSPPSHLLAGSCGGGPEGKHYVVNWFVNKEGDHLFMEPSEKSGDAHAHAHHGQPHVHSHGSHAADAGAPAAAGFFAGVKRRFTQLREHSLHFGRKQDQVRPRMRATSVVELEDGETRTQRAYAKLANRRSML